MRFLIDGERSTLIVAARSSVGPIVFQSQALEGSIDADVVDGNVSVRQRPQGRVSVRLDSLESGNQVYDAELRRRIEARRFPICTITLDDTLPAGDGRFTLDGTMDFHDRLLPLKGTVEVQTSTDRLVVIGEKQLDIRDFGIPAPGILMVKIYPEVEIRLFLEASPEPTTGGAP